MYWLTRHYKQYPIPRVVVSSCCQCSGCYYSPIKFPTLDQDPDFLEPSMFNLPNLNGTIVVSDGGVVVLWPNLSSTIAHEYRHHIQTMKGCDLDPVDLQLSHKDYFSYPSERDALMFELALTGGDEAALVMAEEAKVTTPSRGQIIDWMFK